MEMTWAEAVELAWEVRKGRVDSYALSAVKLATFILAEQERIDHAMGKMDWQTPANGIFDLSGSSYPPEAETRTDTPAAKAPPPPLLPAEPPSDVKFAVGADEPGEDDDEVPPPPDTGVRALLEPLCPACDIDPMKCPEHA